MIKKNSNAHATLYFFSTYPAVELRQQYLIEWLNVIQHRKRKY